MAGLRTQPKAAIRRNTRSKEREFSLRPTVALTWLRCPHSVQVSAAEPVCCEIRWPAGQWSDGAIGSVSVNSRSFARPPHRMIQSWSLAIPSSQA